MAVAVAVTVPFGLDISSQDVVIFTINGCHRVSTERPLLESVGETELVSIWVKNMEISLAPWGIGRFCLGRITMTGCDGVQFVRTLDMEDDPTTTNPCCNASVLQVHEVFTDLQRRKRCVGSPVHRVETQPVVKSYRCIHVDHDQRDRIYFSGFGHSSGDVGTWKRWPLGCGSWLIEPGWVLNALDRSERLLDPITLACKRFWQIVSAKKPNVERLKRMGLQFATGSSAEEDQRVQRDAGETSTKAVDHR